MKKLIIALSIAGTLIATPALAETATAPTIDQTNVTTSSTILTTDTTVPTNSVNVPDPGLTPDSPFYFIDKLIEKVELFLASGDNRAKLLEDFAQERLSEAQAVQNVDTKTQLVNDYINTVNQVKDYIDKQAAAGKDMSSLLAGVRGSSTRGIEILQELAKNNNNPGLQNAINKQETKLAEHLIFAELKQQIRANKDAIADLEQKIADAKAAGQNTDDLEKQLLDLKDKQGLLKDTKKALKLLRKEAIENYNLNIKDEGEDGNINNQDEDNNDEHDKDIEEQDKNIQVDSNKDDENNDKQIDEENDNNQMDNQDIKANNDWEQQKEERKAEMEKEKEARKLEKERNREERQMDKEINREYSNNDGNDGDGHDDQDSDN